MANTIRQHCRCVPQSVICDVRLQCHRQLIHTVCVDGVSTLSMRVSNFHEIVFKQKSCDAFILLQLKRRRRALTDIYFTQIYYLLRRDHMRAHVVDSKRRLPTYGGFYTFVIFRCFKRAFRCIV